MSINRVILTGRIGKEIDLRYTPNGKAVASFNLAVTDSFDREKTHWISIIAWGKSAESCANYLSKGSMVGIEGRINTRNYENQEGRRIYITEVVADRVEFLDSKKKEKSQQGKPNDDWSGLGREVKLEDIDMGDDDDIPF